MANNQRHIFTCKVCGRRCRTSYSRQVVCSWQAIDVATGEKRSTDDCRDAHQVAAVESWNRTAPKAGSRWAVFVRDDFTCVYCGNGPRHTDDVVVLTIDHRIPRSAGGATTMENMVTACKSCNTGKRNTLLKEDARATS